MNWLIGLVGLTSIYNNLQFATLDPGLLMRPLVERMLPLSCRIMDKSQDSVMCLRKKLFMINPVLTLVFLLSLLLLLSRDESSLHIDLEPDIFSSKLMKDFKPPSCKHNLGCLERVLFKNQPINERVLLLILGIHSDRNVRLWRV